MTQLNIFNYCGMLVTHLSTSVYLQYEHHPEDVQTTSRNMLCEYYE